MRKVYRYYNIKISNKEDFQKYYDEICQRLEEDINIKITIPYSDEENKKADEKDLELLIEDMMEALKEMESYHEKQWKDFEDKHIKNYIQKYISSGYIKADIWKIFYKRLENKN